MNRALSCLATVFLLGGATTFLVPLLKPNEGLLFGLGITFDVLPATLLYVLGVRWPFVRQGGDIGLFTPLGGVVFYGGLALIVLSLRRRRLRRAARLRPKRDLDDQA
jgi:hypothetical protein